MVNLIEVEIENTSYIKLLNLDKQGKNTLTLTTLEDNQSAVIIKIFLNKSGNRFPIKEFHVHHLKPKASGLPRFELMCSYENNKIYLELWVDGEKTAYDEVKLNTYLRNKFLPLFVIMGIIAVLLLVLGGKWLIGNVISKGKNPNTQLVRTKSELSIDDRELPSNTTVTEEKTETEIINEVINSVYTAYFTPNNTEIQKEAELKLKNLAKELKNIPKALVKISGYCAMTGTEEGREKLSKERAYNVLDYLKQEGWVSETEPVIKWYGGSQPVTNKPDEIYKNRRVEIEIVLP